MTDNDDTGDPAQRIKSLQEHLTKQSEARKDLAVKLRSGQAEKLICDLETVASCESTGADPESLTPSALPEEEERLTNQSRAQGLHDDPPPTRKNGAHARQVRHTVAERCVKFNDIKTQSTVEPKLISGIDNKSLCTGGDNPYSSNDSSAPSTMQNSHNRDERIKRLEGPADTAKDLAQKLTYFTYYELLYLDDDAKTEEIHAAYVRRTTEIRSRFRSGTQEWRLNEFLRVLHEAHSVLTTDRLRQAYDSRLAAGEWEGSFKDLLAQVPDYHEGSHWAGGNDDHVSIKDLLLCAGFVTTSELDQYSGEKGKLSQTTTTDGTELAQIIADAGLITFEELASVLLGKALIDRRQITVEQFKQAVGDMREHSHKLVDALINKGWLTPSELNLIGID